MRDAGAKKAKNTKLRSTQGQMPLGAIFMLRWWFMIERLAVYRKPTIHQGRQNKSALSAVFNYRGG